MRPLTRMMLEALMECHEREMQSLPPCTVEISIHLKGLYQRGLVEARLYKTGEGKSIVGFYITETGKNYLLNNQ